MSMQATSTLRFGFGENWLSYLKEFGESQLISAQRSLLDMISEEDLSHSRFLDLGCGSGIFSLCARELGAKVVSVDLDPNSVKCAETLRDQRKDTSDWQVMPGSALDPEFLESLGKFDVVYSWGVLHHTGDMWKAIGLAAQRVRPGGLFYLSIYNDQGLRSRIWLKIKQLYNRLPKSLSFLLVLPLYLALLGRESLRSQKVYRGMSLWHDAVDWVGGLPFEVATPEAIFNFLHLKGFQLTRLKTVGGKLGCNEFVFKLTQ